MILGENVLFKLAVFSTCALLSPLGLPIMKAKCLVDKCINVGGNIKHPVCIFF